MLNHYVNLSIFSLITVDETEAEYRPEVRDRLQTMTECKIVAGYEHLCSHGGFMMYQNKSMSNKGKTVAASINASALLYF